MDAIGYARISTQDQSVYSIDGQCADITAFCKRNNLNLHKIFIDNGQSAFSFQRKEWRELESYMKANREVKYLVVAGMDRFSRADLVDSLAKMDDIQKRLKVKILTVTDPVNLDQEDFGVQLRRIMELMFSNYELKKIRKRTSDGLYQSMSVGRWVNKAPFGYINARDSEGKPVLQVDEEKAYMVRAIYRSYINGMEMVEISRSVKANGFKLTGNGAIRRVLSNPLYAGLIQLPKHGNNAPRIVQGIHPAIISEADYWAVQDILNGKNKRQPVSKRSEVWLKGALHCAECGRKMTAGNSRGKSGKYFWYYLCREHRKNYSAKDLHRQMNEILALLSLPAESIQRISDRLKGMVEDKANNRGGDLMKARMALSKIKDRIAAAEEKYLLQPDISAAAYTKVINGLKADEQRMMGQIAQLSSTASNYKNIMAEVLPRLSNLQGVVDSWPAHRKIAFLDLVFDRGLSYKNGSYRTPKLHFLFSHNQQALKEKGLLIIEQPDHFSGEIPGGSGNETGVEHLLELLAVFAA